MTDSAVVSFRQSCQAPALSETKTLKLAIPDPPASSWPAHMTGKLFDELYAGGTTLLVVLQQQFDVNPYVSFSGQPRIKDLRQNNGSRLTTYVKLLL